MASDTVQTLLVIAAFLVFPAIAIAQQDSVPPGMHVEKTDAETVDATSPAPVMVPPVVTAPAMPAFAQPAPQTAIPQAAPAPAAPVVIEPSLSRNRDSVYPGLNSRRNDDNDGYRSTTKILDQEGNVSGQTIRDVERDDSSTTIKTKTIDANGEQSPTTKTVIDYK